LQPSVEIVSVTGYHYILKQICHKFVTSGEARQERLPRRWRQLCAATSAFFRLQH
jgi:hypothetical protein